MQFLANIVFLDQKRHLLRVISTCNLNDHIVRLANNEYFKTGFLWGFGKRRLAPAASRGEGNFYVKKRPLLFSHFFGPIFLGGPWERPTL